MIMADKNRLNAWRIEKDLDSRFISVSEQVLEYVKAKSDDVFLGKTDCDLPWGVHAEIFRQHELDAIAGNNYSMLYPITSPDGDDSLFLHSKAARKDEKNTVVGVSCSIIEVINPDVYKLLLHLKKRSPEDKSLFFLNKNHKKFIFTDREQEVLFFVSKGKTSKEIAKILHVSPKTIEKHIENMKFKTGARSKLELLDQAYEFGFSQNLPSAFSVKDILEKLLE